jgi:hypothetical protein
VALTSGGAEHCVCAAREGLKLLLVAPLHVHPLVTIGVNGTVVVQITAGSVHERGLEGAHTQGAVVAHEARVALACIICAAQTVAGAGVRAVSGGQSGQGSQSEVLHFKAAAKRMRKEMREVCSRDSFISLQKPDEEAKPE